MKKTATDVITVVVGTSTGAATYLDYINKGLGIILTLTMIAVGATRLYLNWMEKRDKEERRAALLKHLEREGVAKDGKL